MIASKNYYLALMCRPGDDAETLKSAKRQIVKRTHSDANGGSEKYRVLFEAAVEAWEVLGDPIKREQYDAAREQWLSERGAVWCEGCGEGLRLPNGNGLRCPLCKTCLLYTSPSPRD